MKADLLTYPLPLKGRKGRKRFLLPELVDSAFASEMDLAAITSYNAPYDNDHRFRDFWESQVFLPPEYKVTPHPWDSETNILSAFSVIHKPTRRKVTFLYGSNSPTKYKDKFLELVRVGIDFREKPHEANKSIDTVIREADERGALVLATAETFLALDDIYLSLIHGVLWKASVNYHRTKRQAQDAAMVRASKTKIPVIPVSNAHLPYISFCPSTNFSELGRAHIEFDEPEYTNGRELVGSLKDTIGKGNYKQHREHSSYSSFRRWAWRMAIRKGARDYLGSKCLDWNWTKGKDPLVRL